MANSKMRLLLLLKILTDKTDAEHRLSVPALIRELEKANLSAERKSVYRDIAALKASGIDIISSSRGYYINRLTLSFSDIKSLISCTENACFLTESAQKNLKLKLFSLANENERKIIEKRGCINAEKAKSDDIFSTIDIICDARGENRQITFSDGTFKNRFTVTPLTVISTDHDFLLVYTTADSNSFKLFSLYSMHDVSMLSVPASPISPPAFEDADSIKRFLCTYDEPPELITLQCDLHCDLDIKKAFSDKFGSNASFSREFGSSFTISLNASPTNGLVSFLAQFGDAITVLSPNSLKDKLCAHFKNALARYKS